MFGGYNKVRRNSLSLWLSWNDLFQVTKNDQWDKVHIKMGLPDEVSSKNGRSIELAYKK